jgi:hypothetical protein
MENSNIFPRATAFFSVDFRRGNFRQTSRFSADFSENFGGFFGGNFKQIFGHFKKKNRQNNNPNDWEKKGKKGIIL